MLATSRKRGLLLSSSPQPLEEDYKRCKGGKVTGGRTEAKGAECQARASGLCPTPSRPPLGLPRSWRSRTLRCGQRCSRYGEAEKDVQSGSGDKEGIARQDLTCSSGCAGGESAPGFPWGLLSETTRREGRWAPTCPGQGAPLHPHAAPSSQGWWT